MSAFNCHIKRDPRILTWMLSVQRANKSIDKIRIGQCFHKQSQSVVSNFSKKLSPIQWEKSLNIYACIKSKKTLISIINLEKENYRINRESLKTTRYRGCQFGRMITLAKRTVVSTVRRISSWLSTKLSSTMHVL